MQGSQPAFRQHPQRLLKELGNCSTVVRWRQPDQSFQPRLQTLLAVAASGSVMDRELKEYELALRARDGDRDALAQLVERTRLPLFQLAYADLRHYDDAQD